MGHEQKKSLTTINAQKEGRVKNQRTYSGRQKNKVNTTGICLYLMSVTLAKQIKILRETRVMSISSGQLEKKARKDKDSYNL
jgi:hypothetical protein